MLPENRQGMSLQLSNYTPGKKVEDLLEVESINRFICPWQSDNKFRKWTIKRRWVYMGSDDSESEYMGDKVMC